MPSQGRRNREIARLYTEEGLTLAAIGARFGITRQRVRQVLEETGVSGRTSHTGLRPRLLAQRDKEIGRLYVHHGLTITQIGQRLGLGYSTVRHALIRAQVRRRSPGPRCRQGTRYSVVRDLLPQRNREMMRLYREGHLTISEIGLQFQRDESTVARILREAGVDMGVSRSGLTRGELMQRNREIVRLRTEEALSAKEIGTRFGLSAVYVDEILRKAGVYQE